MKPEIGAACVDPMRAGHAYHLYSPQQREAIKRAPSRRFKNFAGNLLPFRLRFIPSPIFFAAQFPIFRSCEGKTSACQTAGTYLNRDYSLLTQVETIFSTALRGRTRRTFPARYVFNFNGTAASGAGASIEAAGDGANGTSRRPDLSYRAQLRGWNSLSSNIECASEFP